MRMYAKLKPNEIPTANASTKVLPTVSFKSPENKNTACMKILSLRMKLFKEIQMYQKKKKIRKGRVLQTNMGGWGEINSTRFQEKSFNLNQFESWFKFKFFSWSLVL